MSYLEKYSKYKSKYLDLRNQFGGTITCTPRIVGGDGIDVIIYDNNLPGDLQSSIKDEKIGSYVAWYSWFPNLERLSDNIEWTIKSDLYDKIEEEQFIHRSLHNSKWMDDKWMDDKQLFWNAQEFKDSTELELYKNKYKKLFKTMAINELFKFPKFQEWAKTHSFF